MNLAQQHPVAILGQILSSATILASLLGFIAPVAALVGLVFYSIQIWESRTMQHWVDNRRMLYRAHKIARLRAKEKVITAKLEALEVVRHARIRARDKVAHAQAEAAQLVVSEDTQHKIDLPPV